jgi:teichuronic acid biosynthesis glycosyltransferase TuaC
MIKRITIVASNYPSSREVGRGAFVENFAKGLVNSGVATEVIAPLKLHKATWDASNGSPPVRRPFYLSLSNKGPAPLRHAAQWIARSTFRHAVSRSIRCLRLRPDAFYAHFLESGAALLQAASAGVPLFVGVGESSLESFASRLTPEDLRALSSRVTGFICVSEQLRDELIPLLQIAPEKVLVEPNGVDHQLFRPRPRDEIRRQLNLPADDPIIVIVGGFCSRKGQNRVLEATQGRTDLRFVLVGKGAGLRQDPRVIFQGCVPPELVAQYLAASDLFVLPTQAEGSCNAILEASATGLPVVSSDLPSIRAQFPFGGAIFVDPDDLGAIGFAIQQIIDHPARLKELSAAALQSSYEFGILRRVERILQWMNSRCGSPDTSCAVTSRHTDD